MIKLTSIFASMRPGQDGTDRAAQSSPGMPRLSCSHIGMGCAATDLLGRVN
jgi:hypothetical protein